MFGRSKKRASRQISPLFSTSRTTAGQVKCASQLTWVRVARACRAGEPVAARAHTRSSSPHLCTTPTAAPHHAAMIRARMLTLRGHARGLSGKTALPPVPVGASQSPARADDGAGTGVAPRAPLRDTGVPAVFSHGASSVDVRRAAIEGQMMPRKYEEVCAAGRRDARRHSLQPPPHRGARQAKGGG